MKKITKQPLKSIVNRRASFDYELGEDLIVGIVLTGIETRAARDGHIQLKGSFVTIKNNELFIVNIKEALPDRKIGIAIFEKIPLSKASKEFFNFLDLDKTIS